MRKAVRNSQELAQEIRMWQGRLQPRLADIDPHDLHLILWSILRHRYGGRYNFLMRRQKDGRYVL